MIVLINKLITYSRFCGIETYLEHQFTGSFLVIKLCYYFQVNQLLEKQNCFKFLFPFVNKVLSFTSEDVLIYILKK